MPGRFLHFHSLMTSPSLPALFTPPTPVATPLTPVAINGIVCGSLTLMDGLVCVECDSCFFAAFIATPIVDDSPTRYNNNRSILCASEGRVLHLNLEVS